MSPEAFTFIIFVVLLLVCGITMWVTRKRGNRRVRLPHPYHDERDWIRAFRESKP